LCIVFLSQTNTFQSIIATDGSRTFTVLQYLDNGINWGQCGGNNAQAGVTGYADALGPSTSNIVDIETGSNVGELGKYVYGIHETTRMEPAGKLSTLISHRMLDLNQ